MSNQISWGIDLGGTKIEGIVLRGSGPNDILARERLETEQERGYEHILSRIKLLVEKLSKQSGLSPKIIGIGHPGVLDSTTRLLKNSNTLCLNGKPLKKDFEKLLGIPAVLSNDANCFALAEALFGAARGARVAFGVILGTGVGGGVVVNNEALHGAQGIAGEWGHNILIEDGPECYCRKKGCVETVISGPALERYYSGLSGKDLTFSAIVERRVEDAAAAKTIDRLCTNFGKAIAVIINILDPDCIVLGGGLSNVPDLYSRGATEAKRYIFNDTPQTKIVKNELGDSAGVFGAARLTFEK